MPPPRRAPLAAWEAKSGPAPATLRPCPVRQAKPQPERPERAHAAEWQTGSPTLSDHPGAQAGFRNREILRGGEMKPKPIMHQAAQPLLGNCPVPKQVHAERALRRIGKGTRRGDLHPGEDIRRNLALPPSSHAPERIEEKIAEADLAARVHGRMQQEHEIGLLR